jgi:hypothetical protein
MGVHSGLRLIAEQILSVRKTKKRFAPGEGGAKAYRESILGELSTTYADLGQQQGNQAA